MKIKTDDKNIFLTIDEWRDPLPKSIINNNEKRTFNSLIKIDDVLFEITCEISWNDELNNGHNSFHITGSIPKYGICGAIHDEIALAFPCLQHLLKWHGFTSDGYSYHGRDIQFLASNGDLDNARKLALWPEATKEDLLSLDKLRHRLPDLLNELKEYIEQLGFTY